jgi:hypothetical protein
VRLWGEVNEVICFTLPHALNFQLNQSQYSPWLGPTALLKLSPHTQDQLGSPKKKDISCRVINQTMSHHKLFFLFFLR